TTSTTSDIAQIFFEDNSDLKVLAQITMRKQTASTHQGNLIFLVNDGADNIVEALRIDKDTYLKVASRLYVGGTYYLSSLIANNKVPDSDKVDALHASSFIRADADDNVVGNT
ncbi:unnamed protein product, partial [marine sediment metagenome]